MDDLFHYFSSIFPFKQKEVQSNNGYNLPFASNQAKMQGTDKTDRITDENQLSFSFWFEFNLNLFYAQHTTLTYLYLSVADDHEHIIYLLIFFFGLVITHYTLQRNIIP